ncbi:hypothetical protein [Dyella amyloliquefaciens]|uniref:hypothetical protein n=1 Tax=Dyella amyloliquefaciens TaxID=1770545 RepID=UPI00102E5417|nr:hypothetical protein [Dyella amyloliquefaciens]
MHFIFGAAVDDWAAMGHSDAVKPRRSEQPHDIAFMRAPVWLLLKVDIQRASLSPKRQHHADAFILAKTRLG